MHASASKRRCARVIPNRARLTGKLSAKCTLRIIAWHVFLRSARFFLRLEAFEAEELATSWRFAWSAFSPSDVIQAGHNKDRAFRHLFCQTVRRDGHFADNLPDIARFGRARRKDRATQAAPRAGLATLPPSSTSFTTQAALRARFTAQDAWTPRCR